MAEAETDLFGFTREGFHSGYTRLTRPTSREERLAALDAQRSDVDAAKSSAARGLVTGVPSRATETEGLAAGEWLESFREVLKSATPEQLKTLSDAQLDEELERGIIAKPSPVTDNWEDE